MANANDFKLVDIINDGACITFIGNIDGQPAIMYARHPPANGKNLEHYISREHRIIDQNDIYQTGEVTAEQELNYKLVCPASEEEVRRLRTGWRYVAENYDEYLAGRHLIASGRIDLLLTEPSHRNQSKAYFENEEFLVVADECWDGEPEMLSLVLVMKDEKYVTVRDVDDVGVIERAKRTALELCEKLGIDRSLIVIYCDARPHSRHLHFNIRNIAVNSFSFPFQGWPILVDDLLNNLSYSIDYYKKDVFFLSKVV